jgi:hypothetical protein
MIETVENIITTIFTFFVDTIFIFLTPSQRGHVLFLIHCSLNVIVPVVFFSLPKNSVWRLVIIGIIAFVLSTQIMFGGCIVTKIEQKYIGSTSELSQLYKFFTGAKSTRDSVQLLIVSETTLFLVIFITSQILNSLDST